MRVEQRWSPFPAPERVGLPALFRCVRDQTQCACPSAELARCACAPVFSRSPRQVTSWSAASTPARPTQSGLPPRASATRAQWFRLQEVRAREPVYSRQSQVVSRWHFGRRFCGEHHVVGLRSTFHGRKTKAVASQKARASPIPSDLRLKTDDCILTCTHRSAQIPAIPKLRDPAGRGCVRPRTSAARAGVEKGQGCGHRWRTMGRRG